MVLIRFIFSFSSNPIKDCAGAPRFSPRPPEPPAPSSVRQRGSGHWRRKHGLQGRSRRTTTWPWPKGPVRQGAVGPKRADHRGPQGTGQVHGAGVRGHGQPGVPEQSRQFRQRGAARQVKDRDFGRGDNFPGQSPIRRAAGDNHLRPFFLNQPSGQAGPVSRGPELGGPAGPGVQDHQGAPGLPERSDDLNSRGDSGPGGRRGGAAGAPRCRATLR